MLSQLTLFFLEVSFSVWYRSNGCFFHNVNPTPPPPCVAWKGLPEWAEKRRRAKDSGLFFFFEFQAVLLCYDQQGAAFHHGWFMFWSPPPPNPFVEPALAFFLRTRYSASRGVETLTLLPGQQAALLEKDLHPFGSFVASFEPMGTRTRSVIAPAEGAHQPPHPPPPLRPPPVSLAALLSSRRASPQAIFFFSWLKGKRWKKKKNSRKKEEKKIFGGFRAVISNQSSAILKDESTFE